MTKEELLEMRDWIISRWPNSEFWELDQWVVYYEELADYQAQDVWVALRRLFTRGSEWPPGVSVLVKGTVDARTERIAAGGFQRALPGREGITWREFSEAEYGRYIPFAETISHPEEVDTPGGAMIVSPHEGRDDDSGPKSS